MTPPVLEAREEARPLELAELSEGQKGAARDVYQLLTSLAQQEMEHADTSDDKGRLKPYAHVETSRKNQVILLDGSRGSGKTALLMTLLAEWRRRLDEHLQGTDLRPTSGSRARSPNAALKKQLDEARRKGWAAEIGELDPDSVIVPLESIDLNALPENAALIPYLAGVLRQLVDVISPAPDEAAGVMPVPWALHDGKLPASQVEWGPFIRAVTLSAAQQEQRLARLDSETLVAEREDLERSRLDVGSSFRRFMNALYDDFRSWAKLHVRPLFVISIDDADMHPSHVVELLSVIHHLRHPRLAFLITGDSELFRAMLKVYFAGSMTKPAGAGRFSYDDLAKLGVVTQADTLARRSYEKVIPLQHRCNIPELAPEERTARLFKSPLSAALIQRAEQLFRRHPLTRWALPDRGRQIQSWSEWLQRRERDADSDTERVLAEMVHQLWHEAVSNEPDLNKEQIERFTAPVTLPSEELRALTKEFPLVVTDTTMVKLEPTCWELRPPKVAIAVDVDTGGAELYLKSSHGFTGYIPSPTAPSQQQRVSKRMVAAWELLRAVVPSLSAENDSLAMEYAGVCLSFGAGLQDVPRPLVIPWPAPPWPIPDPRSQYFFVQWQLKVAILHNAGRATASVDDYALAALGAVARVIVDWHEDDPELETKVSSNVLAALRSKATPGPHPGTAPWKEAADVARQLSTLEGEEWALRQLLLFAAPESGLGEVSSRTLLSALEDPEGSRPGLWQAIEDARNDRLQKASGLSRDARFLALRAGLARLFKNSAWDELVTKVLSTTTDSDSPKEKRQDDDGREDDGS